MRQAKREKESLTFPLVLLQAKVVGGMYVDMCYFPYEQFPLVLLQAKVVGKLLYYQKKFKIVSISSPSSEGGGFLQN